MQHFKLRPGPAEGPAAGNLTMAGVDDLLLRLHTLEEDADAKNGQIVVLQQAVANLIRRVDLLESHNVPASSTKPTQGRDSSYTRESKSHSLLVNHSPPNSDSRLPKPKFAGIEKPKRDSKRLSNVSRSTEIGMSRSTERPPSSSIVRSRY